MAAFLNLLGKSKPAMLTSFIGEHLMQQGGCSVVAGWPAQHICMSGVYSPIYSSSRWQWESFYLCVRPLSSQPIFIMALRDKMVNSHNKWMHQTSPKRIQDLTGWERGFTGNCARDLKLYHINKWATEIIKTLFIFDNTRVSKKNYNILEVCVTLWCVYHVTEAVLTVVSTRCDW